MSIVICFKVYRGDKGMDDYLTSTLETRFFFDHDTYVGDKVMDSGASITT